MPEIPQPQNSTVNKIYQSYEDVPQTERVYLGCSTFGTDCERQQWYLFRWAVEPEKFTGRKLRLFLTGHREEERMIEDLRKIGVEVWCVDENGHQFAVEALGGHLRGHLDGVVQGPVEAPATPHVLECKTHNDKSFKDLLIKRVKKSKPGHYAQMMLYMHLMKLERALYMAVNKNDDSLYIERVKYDAKAAEVLMKRAKRIIEASAALPRLFPDPEAREAWVCRQCPALDLCHHKMMPQRRHCRTCISATAHADDPGGWSCDYWDKPLTIEEQRAGCEKHLWLPSLIPGEQVDANEEERWISYKMHDGGTLINDTGDGT